MSEKLTVLLSSLREGCELKVSPQMYFCFHLFQPADYFHISIDTYMSNFEKRIDVMEPVKDLKIKYTQVYIVFSA